jgi:hypothetical protein
VGVGCLGLFDEAPLLLPMALDVIGVGAAFLAAPGLITGSRDVLVGKSRTRQVALDDRQILAEPIEFTQMPLDREALVLRQDLFPEPGPSLGPHRSAAGQDGIRCACRID